MQIEIKYDDDILQLYSQCPICSNKVEVTYDDYVEEHPMIWCWGRDCDCYCEDKYVIGCSIEDISSIEMEEFINGKVFDLLLVTRIANVDDITVFLTNYNKNNNTSFEDLNEISNHMKINDTVLKKKILDEVGKELNSYNIADIKKKYPNYDLSHDGCNILIEVLEKDGSLTVMYFWGD